MKKLLVLVAGIMLVSGVVFGEEMVAQEKKATEWDFAGTEIGYEFVITDSTNDDFTAFGQDGDNNLIIKATKDYGSDLTVSLELDTDDEAMDDSLELILNKKIADDLEVQVAADVNFGENVNVALAEGDDTFIKYSPKEGCNLTIYPYDMDLGMGDELETTGDAAMPGIVSNRTVAGVDIYVGLGGVSELMVDDKNVLSETLYGVKAGAKYEKEALTLSMDMSMLSNGSNPGTDMAVSVMAEYDAELYKLNGELLYADAAEADLGLFAKVSVPVGMVGKYDTTPYASFTMAGEDLFYDGDADMNEIEIGADFEYKALTINPNVVLTTIGDDDTETVAAVSFTVEI